MASARGTLRGMTNALDVLRESHGPSSPVLDLVGYSLSIGWIALMYWGPAVPFSQSLSDYQIHGLRLLMLCAIVIVFWVARTFPAVVNRIGTKGLVAAALLIAGGLAAASSFSFSLSEALQLVIWLITGVLVVMLFLLWYRFDLSFPYKSLNVFSEVSFIILGFTFVVVSLFQSDVARIATGLLPLISIILLVVNHWGFRGPAAGIELAEGKSWKQEAADPEISSLPIKSRLFMVVYSIGIGLAGSLITIRAMAGITVVVIGLSHVLAGIMLFPLLRSYYDVVARLLVAAFLPAMAVSVFLLSFVGVIGRAVCFFVMFFLFAAYDILYWTPTSRSGDSSKLSFGLFTHGRLNNSLGHIIGWVVGMAILYYADAEVSRLIYFAMTVLIVLVTTNVFIGVFREKPQGMPSPFSLREDGSWKRACEEIASASALSERQRETFFLLAKGRNTRYISERLFVSDHTAKSHIYAIYKKLGVHSQQELIDLVERKRREIR